MQKRHSLMAVAFIGAVSLLAACGRSGRDTDTQSAAAVEAAASTLRHTLPAGLALDSALDSIRQTHAPAGVEAEVYEQLRAALLKVLEAGRSSSTPPDPEINVIDDLVVTDLGGGAADLTWTYKNRGDYDLNGEVNISDLTPVGQHIGKTSAHPQWDAAQKADGDGNGEINIADVTPIGQAYGAQVAAFHLYGSDAAEGPWAYLDALPFASGDFGVYPPQFTWNLPVADQPFYLVAPADFEGYDDISSSGGTGAAYMPGTLTELAQATIGIDGGVLDGPAASALEGVHIEVPAGAFPSAADVRLSVDSGTITPADGVWDGPIIDIETGFTEQFTLPISITMPYTGGVDWIPVPYYIDAAGQLDPCQIVDYDPVGGTVTFDTWHSSTYSLIKAAQGPIDRPAYKTGWAALADGFQVQNHGGTAPGGNSWGMSAFAGWYWRLNELFGGTEPDFYLSFMDPVGGPGSGNTGQDIIAFRAQNSLEMVFAPYEYVMTEILVSITNRGLFNIIRSMMVNKGAPIVVWLRTSGGITHAVLAHGYDNNNLDVYDPSVPGHMRRITFGESAFNPFLSAGNTYYDFNYLGTGSFQAIPFIQILADAEASFTAGEAEIFIAAPPATYSWRSYYLQVREIAAPTEIVELRLTAIDEAGSILSIYSRSPWAQGPDPTNHGIGCDVPLQPGFTQIWVETFGRNTRGERVKYTNNLEISPTVVAADCAPTSLWATLTWDSPPGRDDLRLVMIDPNDEVCWYMDPQTPDGAEMHVGLGGTGFVENIAIEESDTTQYGQPYRFRVLNEGPFTQNFRLSVSLNDGLAKYYQGQVSPLEGSPGGDPLSDTGAWWWDGPTVSPQQP